MERFRFDVIVIGCGPAGATAAVTLARSGLSVLVLEAGHYPGAENWSGCVYFGENLAQADAFGEDALPSSPFERPVVRRGAFLHNGLDLVGLSYQQPDTFKHCYTVLRPVFDPYWAALARSHGAMVISGTTATALLRKGKRVIGVETTYGPAYANSVFIAEGDASHLIRREQLEKVSKPHFLQGVKTVLNLPSSVIEERFDLFPGDGCAYEYVIRNGLVGGQTVHLNIGAFLYTNKNSLSVGYVVPLDNLAQHYRGEHAQVLEWIRSLPHFKSLLRDARLAGYGTKLIRMGGRKEQPILVEDGLAVGGAPTGLGIDLPYPNFTGPASASGLYFARALRDLLKDGKPPSAENLKGAYLEPLTRSVYGANADFLAGWPDYMGKTPYLFGKSVDLVCGSAHFLTEPRSALWLTGRFVRNFIGLKTLRSLSADLLDFLKASGMGKSLLSALSPGLILRWFSNLVYLEPKTDLGLTISILIDDRRAIGNRRFSRPFESLIRRLTPGISQAMKIVYTNDDTPLEEKFTRAFRSILKRVKITDFITLPITILILVSLGVLSGIWDLIRYKILRRPLHEIFSGPVHEYMESQKDARNINGPKPKDTLDAKLALNSYRLTQNSHIRILWPAELTRQSDLNQSALWSVCPAKVYQYEAPLFGRGRTGINFENCIKCESCWHSEEDQVLWGRHTNHSLIYRSDSDSIDKLLVQKPAERAPNPPETLSPPPLPEFKTPEQRQAFGKTGASVLNALGAFETAVASLPSSADTTRVNWVKKVGETVLGRLDNLEKNYPKED
ncbi:MAG TPA: FAD-dependent oxidoreductase, partial [Nitrospiria bacterium]